MDVLGELLGESPGIVHLRGQLRRLLHAGSQRLPNVLIQGETGTGKGLLARLLHRASVRRDAPFVEVNCAAIPESLLESEMFGFERGAFTDAREAKPGLFQMAHRGALLLDEIGLLPTALEAKLLKVLDDGAVRRLGGSRVERVDVWTIAATNRPLKDDVAAGRFREDLYHRLAVVSVELPPLRERGDDILILARHLLARIVADYGLPGRTLTPDAEAALLAYPWPGNVRELNNVLERAALLHDARSISAGVLDLRVEPATTAAAQVSASMSTDSVLRAHLASALAQTRWNISEAARRLGLSRNTVRARIARYDLRPTAPTDPYHARRHRTDTAASDATVDESARPPSEQAAAPRAAPAAEPPWPDVWEHHLLVFLRVRMSSLAVGVVQPALDAALDKIRAFGGQLDAASPAALLAIFGFETAPEPATAAALAARAIIRATQADGGRGVECRIAIHTTTALVRWRRATLEIDEEGRRAAADVSDVAARAAAPGEIRVTRAAAEILAHRFALTSADGDDLRLVGRAAVRRSVFVGRQPERASIEERLQLARRGQGQVIGISGAAGVGKSRLVRELLRDVRIRGDTDHIEAGCLPLRPPPPYLPVVDLVRQLCDVGPLGADTAARRALQQAGMSVEENLPSLLRWITSAPEERLEEQSPVVVEAGMFAVALQLVCRRSRSMPLIVLVEDVHWIDPGSDRWLGALAEALATIPVALILTYRQTYRPAWSALPHAVQVELPPLSPGDSLLLIRAALGARTIPAEVEQSIQQRAAGNPLFLEELACATGSSGPGPSTIPASVNEVLASRLATVTSDQHRLLTVAAVMEPDVPIALLAAVTGRPVSAVQATADELIRLDFLEAASARKPAQVRFRHRLMQEAATGILSDTALQAVHRAALAALERAEVADPEKLARHALAAHDIRKAVVHLRQAGREAFYRSAYTDAVERFERALGLGLDDPVLTIDIILDARNALLVAGRIDRIGELLAQARDLAERIHDADRLASVHVYFSHYGFVTGRVHEAEAHVQRATRLLAASESEPDTPLQRTLTMYAGMVAFGMGHFARGEAILARLVDELRSERPSDRMALPAVPAAIARVWLAMCLNEQGKFVEARSVACEAIDIAGAAHDPTSLAQAHSVLANTLARQGDLDNAADVAERASEIGREFPLLSIGLRLMASAFCLLTGRDPGNIDLLRAAMDMSSPLNLGGLHGLRLTLLARVELAVGAVDRALDAATRALEAACASEQPWIQAYALHARGDVLARHPDGHVEAERAQRAALDIALAHEMRPLVARCHASLAALHARAGKESEADAERRIAVGMFTEMQMRGEAPGG